jgi:hypothetical protein
MKKGHPNIKSAKTKWVGKRIAGCQSTNHTVCKGELWECRRCHRNICWEEGYDDELVDLCDDCWYDIKVLGHKLSIGVVSTWSLSYETT